MTCKVGVLAWAEKCAYWCGPMKSTVLPVFPLLYVQGGRTAVLPVRTHPYRVWRERESVAGPRYDRARCRVFTACHLLPRVSAYLNLSDTLNEMEPRYGG
jgi:hypothetical protein